VLLRSASYYGASMRGYSKTLPRVSVGDVNAWIAIVSEQHYVQRPNAVRSNAGLDRGG
jgi:hypothetical protein